MAIIIRDHEPAGKRVEVQFPGSEARYTIASADILTVRDLIALREGDFQCIADLFEGEAREHFLDLRQDQLKEFVEAWTGDAKN